MALYFFHLIDGRDDLDEEGTELASWEEARLETLRYAGAVVKEHPERYVDHSCVVQVTDELGKVLFLWSQSSGENVRASGAISLDNYRSEGS